jgi:hypothetical protein
MIPLRHGRGQGIGLGRLPEMRTSNNQPAKYGGQI